MAPTAVFFVVSVAFAFVLGYAYRSWKEFEPPTGPVEELLEKRRQTIRERYETGAISRQQFAAEIEIIEDPNTEKIMHLARDVDGIGPKIAYKIARNYESVQALATAQQDDLEAINRVGENRAHAVLQRAKQELESSER